MVCFKRAGITHSSHKNHYGLLRESALAGGSS